MFHDGCLGFLLVSEKLANAQLEMQKHMPQMSLTDFDARHHFYGRSEGWSSPAIHQSTQGELKERTKKDGPNAVLLANLCVVSIYSFWEDHYRSAIGNYLGIKRADLKSDIFGDLRIIRHSILHHGAIALPTIQRCKLLTWFSAGDEIKIDGAKFDEIAAATREYLTTLEPMVIK